MENEKGNHGMPSENTVLHSICLSSLLHFPELSMNSFMEDYFRAALDKELAM